MVLSFFFFFLLLALLSDPVRMKKLRWHRVIVGRKCSKSHQAFNLPSSSFTGFSVITVLVESSEDYTFPELGVLAACGLATALRPSVLYIKKIVSRFMKGLSPAPDRKPSLKHL